MLSKTEHSRPAKVRHTAEGPVGGVGVGAGGIIPARLSDRPVCVCVSCCSLCLWAMGTLGSLLFSASSQHLAQRQALSGSSVHAC